MKRMLAAILTALMLVTFLPLASPPAQAAGVTFTIRPYIGPVELAYVGEEASWIIVDVTGGSGNFLFALDIYKDGQLFAGEGWHDHKYRSYTFSSPGKYKVRAWVRDLVDNKDYDQFSTETTVKANPLKITGVVPLGASSLRITWNTVPGKIWYDLGDWTTYELYRSTDMEKWEYITMTPYASFNDTSLKAGTRYFYRVGYTRLLMSDPIFSSVASGVPMAETRITSLTSPSARRIRMTWAKAAGASGYQVAMATSVNGSYRSVRIVTGGTTAIFSGVKSGTTLFFKVRPYRRVYSTTYWGQYSAFRSVRVK